MRERKFPVVLLVLTVGVFLSLPLPWSLRLKAGIRDSFLPFQRIPAWFGAGVKGVKGLFSGFREDQAKDLHEQEVARLRMEVWRLQSVQQENRDLRQLMQVRQAHDAWTSVACRVIARGDVAGFQQAVTVRGGRASGISTNMPVLSADGLVGVIAEVSEQTSLVLLLTDPDCRVACCVEGASSTGILRGRGVSLSGKQELELYYMPAACGLDYLPAEVAVDEGRRVLTSGLGGVFPEGIPVGRVVRSWMHSSGLYRQAEIMPAAQFQTLEYVLVLTGKRSQ